MQFLDNQQSFLTKISGFKGERFYNLENWQGLDFQKPNNHDVNIYISDKPKVNAKHYVELCHSD